MRNSFPYGQVLLPVDGLQRENTALKDEMLQMATTTKEEFEGQSIALRKENADVVSTIEKQMDSITAIQEENTQLKDKVTAIANRLVSIEQREHGHSGLPLVVTTMAGFNFGNIVGKGKPSLFMMMKTQILLIQ